MKQHVLLCKHCRHELKRSRAGMRLQEAKSWFRYSRCPACTYELRVIERVPEPVLLTCTQPPLWIAGSTLDQGKSPILERSIAAVCNEQMAIYRKERWHFLPPPKRGGFPCHFYGREALDRQLREVLAPLGVEVGSPDGANESLQEVRRRQARQNGPFVEIVCLYAEEDERYWEQLFEHFTALQDDRLSWHPCKVSQLRAMPIEPLLNELEQAHIVLVLVSVDLLLALVHSDHRLEKTLARVTGYEAHAFASFAVVLRSCAWEGYQFAQLSTVLPKNGRPVTHWRWREASYVEVVQAVCAAVETA